MFSELRIRLFKAKLGQIPPLEALVAVEALLLFAGLWVTWGGFASHGSHSSRTSRLQSTFLE